MNLSTYLEAQGRGSATQLAKAIGAYSSDMTDWTKGNRPVPVKFAVAIEAATDKQVTRKDLFPADWHLIWPELAEPPAVSEVVIAVHREPAGHDRNDWPHGAPEGCAQHFPGLKAAA